MSITFLWVVCVVAMLLLAAGVGYLARKHVLGILIDSRGRYSLSQLQLVAWTLLVLSLVAALCIARLLSRVPGVLDFAVPNELLLVMGLSSGGAVFSFAVKSSKDAKHPQHIAASNSDDRPHFMQVFLVEEGKLADKIIDVSKFQNFVITAVLVVAYVAMVVALLRGATSIADVSLPGFSDTFLTLLAISHAAYLGGKLPDHAGTPDGLSVALRNQGAVPGPGAATALAASIQFQPRNR